MSKLGLALGGGGARGIAHIGVLKVLEEEKIKISCITGSSMGAVIGGLYAYFGNAQKVEDFILEAIKNPKIELIYRDTRYKDAAKPNKYYIDRLINYFGERLNTIKAMGRLSYFDDEITNNIFQMIPDVSIESLGLKFSAVATDLISGEEINFTKGSLRTALKASSAIPGIFPPVEFENMLLVDGSTSESVPVAAAKQISAYRVLAVDVARRINVISPTRNILDILYRIGDITSYKLSLLRLQEADLILSPEVKQLSWVDFDKAAEIIAEGETITRENLGRIKKLISRNSYFLEIDRFIKKIKRNAQTQFQGV
jgi:NTE family protein